MKFQKLEGLERHFKDAYPSHLSAVYAVICQRDSERKKILSSLVQMLERECDCKKCTGLQEALIHLNSASLFSNKMAALFDGIDLLDKEELDFLSHYIQNPNGRGHLILGAANAKIFADIYKVGKKEMVVLDLSKEKPWEEKERLQKWIVQILGLHKKKITREALESFYESLPKDRLLLEQEMDKLTCFLGDRVEVTKKDVQEICSSTDEVHLFQFARSLVWGENTTSPILTDISFLLPLISQLRFQLEMGLKMSALLIKGKDREVIAKAFPKLWPKALEEALRGAKQKGKEYFQNALRALFDLEFGLKTSLGKPEILFLQFFRTLR